MFPMTSAEQRLDATLRSRIPFVRIGTNSASVDESTSLINDVATSLFNADSVCFTGSIYAWITSGMIFIMSTLSIVEHSSWNASRVLSFTSRFTSFATSISFKIIWYKFCFTTSVTLIDNPSVGLFCVANDANNTNPPHLVCHFMEPNDV